ncbi:MAG: response regulator transcription factor [Bacteroidetes bacterium]|nr:response regulator transcription factor [Bacteroidota bacterium]
MIQEYNPKTRIFLVDDHQFIVDGIKSTLEKEPDFEIIGSANNGKQCMQFLNSNSVKPHVIVTDYSMPNMDGLALVKAVKASYPEIKMLVLSMHETINHVQQIADAEAEGYLLKSSETLEMAQAIRQVYLGGTFYSQRLIPVLLNMNRTRKQSNIRSLLSTREAEVLELILEELSSKEIADKLFISKRTVDTHRINIMEKTGSKTILGLYKYAVANSLVNE